MPAPYVVDSTLELDSQGSLPRVLDILSKVKRNPLTLLIVCDVLALASAVRLELGALQLELMGIEHDIIPALVILNVELDGYGALVAKLSSIFDVVQGNVVVRRLCPVLASVLAQLIFFMHPIVANAFVILRHEGLMFVQRRGIVDVLTDQLGRISRSDAMT